MIINKTTKQVQTMSTHPNDNWLGDEWSLVPPELHAKALEFAPFCDLTFDGDTLTDITDKLHLGDNIILCELLAPPESLNVSTNI